MAMYTIHFANGNTYVIDEAQELAAGPYDLYHFPDACSMPHDWSAATYREVLRLQQVWEYRVGEYPHE